VTKSIARLLAACLLAITCGATAEEAPEAPGTPDLPDVPERVARVGDYVITGEAYRRNLQYRLLRARMAAGEGFEPDARFQRRVLSELIEARILRQLAEGSGVAADEAAVDREVARGRSAFPSDEDYAAWLDATGIDEAGLREEVRARLLIEAYVARETADVTVNDGDLRAEYEKLQEQGAVYRKTKTADFVHLFIRARGTDLSDWSEARGRIEELRGRILAGESMEALAREYSDDPRSAPRGGMYYETRREDAPELFADLLFSQPLDQVSEPLRGPQGWHLVKVTALHNPGTVSFEELAPILREGVLGAKKAAAVAERVRRARERIPVELYTAEGEAVPLPPPTAPEDGNGAATTPN